MRSLLSLILAGAVNLSLAAEGAIGIAVARGSFQLDGATISGTATLFEGTSITTSAAGSELRLNNGVRLELAGGSRASVYGDRLVLNQGDGTVASARAYRIEALGLRIRPSSPHALARVAVTPNRSLIVAASAEPVLVTKTDGLLLARVRPGAALEIALQEAATSTTQVAGTLEKKNGHYLLSDSTSGVTVELTGTGLDRYVGKRVEVKGTVRPGTAAGGASHIVRVDNIQIVSGAAGRAAGAATTAMSTGTKVLIAGAVIGSASIGTAIGLTRGEEKPPISR